jgi:hypothetical protein
MISSPHDPGFAELDVEQEWTKLQGVLSGLEQNGLIQLERLETATLSALRQQLRRDDWHVLHFIGLGGFDTHAQDGVLVLEDQAGGSRLVTAQALGVPLHNHDPLRLVVLNACEGAPSDPTNPFAGTAQTLIHQGIPAVVAMQFEISDPAAITFTGELYAAVADGYPLDAALSQARQAIYTDVSEVEWATPVLYLRAPDGRIFDITPTLAGTPTAEAREQAEREQARREPAEREAREAREREAREREAREREPEWEAAEWRAAQLRTASDSVDHAEALLRGRKYARALAVCAEVRREFGNSADPALADQVERARELSRHARQQLARRPWRRWGAALRSSVPGSSIPPERPRPDDEVSFTAGYPGVVTAQHWYPLSVYIHLSRLQAEADRRIAEESRWFGQRPAGSKAAAQVPLPKGTRLRVSPEVRGVAFNPPTQELRFLEDLQQVVFRLQATSEAAGQTVLGAVEVHAGPLLVAQVPLSIHVRGVGEAEWGPGTATASTGRLFSSVFASYAHEDDHVVRACTEAYRALGIDVLVDTASLRSGENWQQALRRLIEKADVFQLYWSEAASRSHYVAKEWQHAVLLQDRKGERFIRPLYWTSPWPPPPAQLEHLHFASLDLGALPQRRGLIRTLGRAFRRR